MLTYAQKPVATTAPMAVTLAFLKTIPEANKTQPSIALGQPNTMMEKYSILPFAAFYVGAAVKPHFSKSIDPAQ